MPEPVTIVASRRYGRTDCVIEATYIEDQERQRAVERMAVGFCLNRIRDIMSTPAD